MTSKTYYQNNKEKILASNAKWRAENKQEHNTNCLVWYYKDKKNDPVKYLIKHARARAKKKGLEFDITAEDIIIPDTCPILGTKLSWDIPRLVPSLDRKDSTKGYTRDNIWIISTLANRMKWDSTKEERILFAKGILSLEGG